MWTGSGSALEELTDIAAEENNHDKNMKAPHTSTLYVLFNILHTLPINGHKQNDFPIIVFISLQEAHVLII